MPENDTLLQKMRQLRREIHRHPEVAGEEQETAKRIEGFIGEYHPDQVIRGIGGTGIVFLFKGQHDGPTVMVRSELDALPIPEVSDLSYRSKHEGKGHLCGHDGHMAMVAGLAGCLSQKKEWHGDVALMFQPAEETGEGAGRMINDPTFAEVKPDYIFALHNLPRFPKNRILVKEGIFASASKGLVIALQGKTSHAAAPENGTSPSMAVSEIIKMIETVRHRISGLNDFALATTVHVKVGERTFGVTPGSAVVMTTIRAYRDDDLQLLEKQIVKEVRGIAGKHGLKAEISSTEVFNSTLNDPECCNTIKTAAKALNMPLTTMQDPFRWSEDFGLFTQKYKGAMFGLGSGEDTPDLHNPDYNFPEEIMETGMLMFKKIIDSLLSSDNA